MTVTSANDHDPVWNPALPTSAISVNEDTAIGTSIHSVTATDDDYGNFGTLTYAIVSVTGGMFDKKIIFMYTFVFIR